MLLYLITFLLIPFRRWRNIVDGVGVKGKKDGLGAQLQAQYSAYLYANAQNIKYVFIKPTYIHHFKKEDQNQAIAQFCAIFGFDQLVVDKNTSVFDKEVDLNSFWSMLKSLPLIVFSKQEMLFTLSQFNHYADMKIHHYDAIRDHLRACYQKEISPKKTSSNILKVALHVRRGDVQASQNAHRYTSNEQILAKILQIQKHYQQENKQLEFYLYSQGDKASFGDEIRQLVHFKLNQDVFETFNELVQADILLMAKSSLSYCAGILSRGTVFYEAFWHKALLDWKLLD